jgi:hypothetical protein
LSSSFKVEEKKSIFSKQHNFFSFNLLYRKPRSRELEQQEKSAKNMIAISINCNLILLVQSKQLTVEEEQIFQSSSSFNA